MFLELKSYVICYLFFGYLKYSAIIVCSDNSAEFEYKNVARDVYPKNEVQIYTWKDATLKEISLLLKGGHRCI